MGSEEGWGGKHVTPPPPSVTQFGPGSLAALKQPGPWETVLAGAVASQSRMWPSTVNPRNGSPGTPRNGPCCEGFSQFKLSKTNKKVKQNNPKFLEAHSSLKLPQKEAETQRDKGKPHLRLAWDLLSTQTRSRAQITGSSSYHFP